MMTQRITKWSHWSPEDYNMQEILRTLTDVFVLLQNSGVKIGSQQKTDSESSPA